MDSNDTRRKNTLVNCFIVLSDPAQIRRVALTCRCKRRWVEIVPGELHDSQLIIQFECPQCGTLYRLHNKILTRVKEDSHDPTRLNEVHTVHNDGDGGYKYDA